MSPTAATFASRTAIRAAAVTTIHAGERPLTDGEQRAQRLLRLSALLAQDPNPLSQDMSRSLLAQAFALTGGKLRPIEADVA